jgi:hypothetical protein
MTEVVVRVVDTTGRGVANAEVHWVDQASIAKARRNKPEAPSLGARLLSIGTPARCDADGRVRIQIVGSNLGVVAHSDGRGGIGMFEGVKAGGGELRVTLGHDFSLGAALRDPENQPLKGLPIAVIGDLADVAVLTSNATSEDWLSRTLLGAPLGTTDESGDLDYSGWGEFRRALAGAAPRFSGHLRLAGHYCGFPESASVAVVEGVARLVVVGPRPEMCRLDVMGSCGKKTDMDGIAVTIGAASGRLVYPVPLVRNGESSAWIVPGSEVCFEARVGNLRVGGGRARLMAPAHYELECPEVLLGEARLAHGADAAGVMCEVDSPYRSPSQKRCAVQDGVVRVALLTGEVPGLVRFRAGDRIQVVHAGAPRNGVVDLGELDFTSRPFATVHFVAEDGGALEGCILNLCQRAGETSLARSLEWRPGNECNLFAPDFAGATLPIRCEAKGMVTQFLDLHRGDDVTVALKRLGSFDVAVRLARGAMPDNLFVRLERRWSAERQEWHFADHWSPVLASGSGCAARFQAIAAGRYTASVWSACPAAVMARASVEIGNDPGPVIEALGTRDVEVTVRSAKDVGGKCYCLAGGAARQATVLEPLELGESKLGTRFLTFSATEMELLVLAGGCAPLWVDVSGVRVEALLVAAPEGLMVGSGRGRWLDSRFRGERPMDLMRIVAGQVQRDVCTAKEVFEATGICFPSDWEASPGRTWRWRGASWELEGY